MKKEFPFYKSCENGRRINPSAKIEEKLNSSDKKLIYDFCRYCSINSKGEKRAENTKRVMIQFCDFIEKPLAKLQDKDFLSFAEAIKRSNRTANGKNDVRIVVKRYGVWIEKTKNKNFPSLELLKFEAIQGSSKIKNPNDLITELEFDKLLKATKNLMHKTLICLLWESAGRPEEILKLRWTDVDFSKNNIKLHSAKTGKFRVVPVEVSIQHLKRLKEESGENDEDFIFTSQKKEIQLSNTSFNFILKNLSMKAGIKKHITGYTFRHTRLSFLIKKLSPKVYEMFSGHSLEMGMKTYAHLNLDDITNEMKEKIFGAKELTKEENQELVGLRTEVKKTMKQIKELQTREQNWDKHEEELLKFAKMVQGGGLMKQMKEMIEKKWKQKEEEFLEAKKEDEEKEIEEYENFGSIKPPIEFKVTKEERIRSNKVWGKVK